MVNAVKHRPRLQLAYFPVLAEWKGSVQWPPYRKQELRLRLRAARVLMDLTVKDLAELVDPDDRLGERTLRKFEVGETALRPAILRALAAAMQIPYEWFTVASIWDVFKLRAELIELAAGEIATQDAAPGMSFNERVEALEAKVSGPPLEDGGPDADGDHEPNPEAAQQASGQRAPRASRPAREQ